MKIIQEKIGILKGILLLIIIGLLIGIVFGIIWRDEVTTNQSSLQLLFVDNLKNTKIQHLEFFYYIAGKRLKDYFFLWIFSLTILSKGYQVYYLLYKSFLCGFVSTVVVLLYGMKGIVLFVSYCMPHYLIYIPIIIITILQCFRFNGMIRQQTVYKGSSRLKWIISEILICLLLGGFILLGCYLESYQSLYFVNKALTMF